MRIPFALAVALSGCADDGPVADPYKCRAAGGAGCFELPTEPLAAADPMGNPVAPVLDCGPHSAATSSGPVTFTGKTLNVINKAMIPNVRIEVFEDIALTVPLGDLTSSDTGDWTLTIHPGGRTALTA